MDNLARYDLDAKGFVEAREALGYSAPEIARVLGRCRQTVWTWETGQTPVPRVVGLAMAFLKARYRLDD